MQHCRHFSCKNKSTCAHRAFWANSQPSLCKRVMMLFGASQLQRMSGKVEGLDQTQETVQRSRASTECSSPIAKAAALWSIRESNWAAEWGFPGEKVGSPCKKSLWEPCVAPGDTCVLGCPSWLVSKGLRCVSSTICFVGAQLAPCRFIWILGGRK